MDIFDACFFKDVSISYYAGKPIKLDLRCIRINYETFHYSSLQTKTKPELLISCSQRAPPQLLQLLRALGLDHQQIHFALDWRRILRLFL
jgi:hypothetical protein